MLFERLLSTDPSKVALKYPGGEIRYGELLRQVRERAGWLRRHPADYLLCHPSETENLVNFLALLFAGQKGVFSGKNISGKLALAEKHGLHLLDFIPSPSEEMRSAYRPAENDLFLGILRPNDILWKDYRSWFSAFPMQSEIFRVGADDRVMTVDALGYSANLNTVLHTLWLGATVVLTPLADADQWADLIRRENISSLFLVPSHYRLLPDNLVFPGVKSAVSAGEKLDPALAAKLLRIFPDACLTEYYGAAELGHITYLQNREIIGKPACAGRPFPGVSLRVRNDKIWVESPYVSPAYRRCPTVSDLGFIDQKGYLCLLGRGGKMFQRREVNPLAEEIASPASRRPTLLLHRETPKSQNELHLFLLKKALYSPLFPSPLYAENLPETSSGKINFKILAKKPVDEDATLPLRISFVINIPCPL